MNSPLPHSPTVRLPGWKLESAKRYIREGYSDLAIHTFSHLSVEQICALRNELEAKRIIDAD